MLVTGGNDGARTDGFAAAGGWRAALTRGFDMGAAGMTDVLCRAAGVTDVLCRAGMTALGSAGITDVLCRVAGIMGLRGSVGRTDVFCRADGRTDVLCAGIAGASGVRVTGLGMVNAGIRRLEPSTAPR